MYNCRRCPYYWAWIYDLSLEALKMSEKLISQGAEASIFLNEDVNQIIKRRIKKSYRIAILDDRIRKQRTRSEAKLIEKAFKVIPVPQSKKKL